MTAARNRAQARCLGRGTDRERRDLGYVMVSGGSFQEWGWGLRRCRGRCGGARGQQIGEGLVGGGQGIPLLR